MISYEYINKRLIDANQSHLLNFWDDLTNQQKNDFLIHLNSINYEEVNNLFKKATSCLNSENVKKLDNRMKPIPPIKFESEEGSTESQLEKYRQIGLNEISDGHVGVLLLAGGQGTRLGISYPKGMYSVGLLSGKTLFQLQAERIKKLQELAKCKTSKSGVITWYIMTSESTEEATKEFLEKNNYFGLESKNIVQFEQGVLPCFDMNGRIILEEKDRISLAPDGNGGAYRALKENGILTDMANRGIRYLHVHSVDNILVKVADPIFIGYCVDKQADCGAKVVKKSSPSEAVGVVCQVDDRFRVVEYSEITANTANLRNQSGDLVFSAGSICNHFFTVQFLEEVTKEHENKLELHVAKKKIPCVNKFGEKEIPLESNGIKIEKFIFDVFPFSDNFVTWEVPRHTEFSALKNTDDIGRDCPSSAKKDLYRLHKYYIEAAGGVVKGDIVEISPLLSYAGEGLCDKVKGKVFESPVLLIPEN
ncbi:hypothetical protein ILUMI_06516 [Ignelater luminosus]|uniref:UDP-N-acetylglucosamine diphosphorylase n=1 Tax=Ignelater luminosus TaxID=2038154 RepID=A0A8K0GHN8_IGNLU|nr:hypothetical protein ILUMI_06516 [Ignelater luminosus]